MTDNHTPPVEEPLTQVGWWCWRGDNRGHLATQACRSDNVPIHVPAEWADEMRAVIERIEDGDEDEQPAAVPAAVSVPPPTRAAEARVRALHQQYAFGSDPQHYCAHCNQISGGWIPWPCPTIKALDGKPDAELRRLAAEAQEPEDDGPARVRALHRKASHGETCVYCAHGQRLGYDTTWPCDTIRALDGTEAQQGGAL